MVENDFVKFVKNKLTNFRAYIEDCKNLVPFIQT